MSSAWRTGRHYGVHVYRGQEPVATFFDAGDAALAVAAVNMVKNADAGNVEVMLGAVAFLLEGTGYEVVPKGPSSPSEG